jgi:hypothetical protein
LEGGQPLPGILNLRQAGIGVLHKGEEQLETVAQLTSTPIRISLIPARFSSSLGDKGNNNGDQAEKDNNENEEIVPRVVIGQE